MPVNIRRLRAWFAVAVLAIVVVVAGFYFYDRRSQRVALPESSEHLGIKIQQSTQGFSLSKSEAGRTLFTVRAERTTQYDGGRAELHEVNILLYGRESNRFDQIYGSDFEYDPATGNVAAKGAVHIDLQANTDGAASPDQAPPKEMKNPVHLTTSGLVFNQKSGTAQTNERLEFTLPQASGYADGATYDSKLSQVLLHGNIHIKINGANPTVIVAQRGTIAKQPRQVILYNARIERSNSTIHAGELTAFLRDDNSVERIFAANGVQSQVNGATMLSARAPQAWLYLKAGNLIKSLNLSGGATFHASGANTMSGSADLVTMDFKGHNSLDKVHTQGNVKLLQPPKPSGTAVSRRRVAEERSEAGQTVEVAADVIDFWIRNGRYVQRAETGKNAQMTIWPATQSPTAQGERTVVTAAKFFAGMSPLGRLSSLTGYPDAKVVSYASGKPGRVSTSRIIDVGFGPAGEVNKVVQRDQFEYREPLPNGVERAGWAQSAAYSPETEVLTLSGRPRVVEGGMTTTANVIRLDRRSGDATADGDVKTTYNDVQPSGAQGGGWLASGEPIHVIARSMNAQRSTGIAHYAGHARLWQGANIIEAASIDFDQNKRTLTAKARSAPASGEYVTTILVQPDGTGRLRPATITSSGLIYSDNERKAHYSGPVTVRSPEGKLMANQADAFFRPAVAENSKQRGGAPLEGAGRNELEKIVAEGSVHLQQPNREGWGDKLIYTPAEEKYVLSGGSTRIFDAERGTIRGASLTFFSRDDRVLMEGTDSSRTITNTRVSK